MTSQPEIDYVSHNQLYASILVSSPETEVFWSAPGNKMHNISSIFLTNFSSVDIVVSVKLNDKIIYHDITVPADRTYIISDSIILNANDRIFVVKASPNSMSCTIFGTTSFTDKGISVLESNAVAGKEIFSVQEHDAIIKSISVSAQANDSIDLAIWNKKQYSSFYVDILEDVYVSNNKDLSDFTLISPSLYPGLRAGLVDYVNGFYIFAGVWNGFIVLTTQDFVTWNSYSSAQSVGGVHQSAYNPNNGVYLLSGTDSQNTLKIWSTTDFINWSYYSEPSVFSYMLPIYDDIFFNKFIYAKGSYFYSSDNGISWTQTNKFNPGWFGAEYPPVKIGTSYYYPNVSYTNAEFTRKVRAVNFGNPGISLFPNTNFDIPIPAENFGEDYRYFWSIVGHNDKFFAYCSYAVADESTGENGLQYNFIVSTQDFVNWNTSISPFGLVEGGNVSLYSVFDKIVLVRQGSSTIAESDDGITWSIKTLPSPVSAGFSVNNSQYFAAVERSVTTPSNTDYLYKNHQISEKQTMTIKTGYTISNDYGIYAKSQNQNTNFFVFGREV